MALDLIVWYASWNNVCVGIRSRPAVVSNPFRELSFSIWKTHFFPNNLMFPAGSNRGRLHLYLCYSTRFRVFDLYLAMDLFSIPMGISPFSKPKQEVNMLPRKGWRSVRGKICPIKQFIYSIQLGRHDDDCDGEEINRPAEAFPSLQENKKRLWNLLYPIHGCSPSLGRHGEKATSGEEICGSADEVDKHFAGSMYHMKRQTSQISEKTPERKMGRKNAKEKPCTSSNGPKQKAA